MADITYTKELAEVLVKRGMSQELVTDLLAEVSGENYKIGYQDCAKKIVEYLEFVRVGKNIVDEIKKQCELTD
jgi:hypothetical protein